MTTTNSEKGTVAVDPGSAGVGSSAARPTICAVSIDWQEFSAKWATEKQLAELAEAALGKPYERGSWTTLRSDTRWYDAEGLFGARLRCDRLGQVNKHGDREPWAGIRLPGQACRAAGSAGLIHLLIGATERWRVKASRVDLALDDLTKRFTPRQFAQRAVDGDLSDEKADLASCVVTRVKRDNWDWSRRMGGCFWVGGKSSDRLLRVYDKDAESGGAIAATRLELQTRNRFATAMAGDLVQAWRSGKMLAEVFAGHLLGLLDFRKATESRSNSARWERASWWRDFIGDVRKAVVGRRDQAGSLAWLHAVARQGRAGLEVALRLGGVTPADLGLLRGQRAGTAGRMAEVLDAMLGDTVAKPLGKRHRAHLEALREALADPVVLDPRRVSRGSI